MSFEVLSVKCPFGFEVDGGVVIAHATLGSRDLTDEMGSVRSLGRREDLGRPLSTSWVEVGGDDSGVVHALTPSLHYGSPGPSIPWVEVREEV